MPPIPTAESHDEIDEPRHFALGSLPVVAAFCRHLDIAGIVDRACPVRDLAT